ncbi:hypothetical protein CR513_05114, partial [Mucuna pruriens]
MKIISLVLFTLLVLFIGIDNEGPLKVIEAKICDVKLYDYCDENCYTDCSKKYGKRAIGICNPDAYECICRYKC